MFSCVPGPRRASARKHHALLLVLFLTAAGGLRAQVDFTQFPPQPLPDTAAPLLPSYGFNAGEFAIGGYIFVDLCPNDDNRLLWPWLRTMGMKVMELRTFFQYPPKGYVFDTLANELHPRDPATGKWDERLIVSSWPWDRVGNAHQTTFFPFDSSESYYWPCLFLNRKGGDSLARNGTEFNRKGDSVQERVYTQTNTTANDTILGHIVIGYDSARQKYAWPSGSDQSDYIEVHGEEFRNRRWNTYLSQQTMYIAVKGHLFDPRIDTLAGTGNDNDSLFTVDVWLQVPRGTAWIDSLWPRVFFFDSAWKHPAELAAIPPRFAPDRVIFGFDSTVPPAHRDAFVDSIRAAHSHTAVADTELLYTQIQVRKRDLAPIAGPNFDYAQYREASYMINAVKIPGHIGGPWHPNVSPGRFDVRVRWSGREKAALRSVAIRDTMAQLVYGADAVADSFRSRLHQATEYLLRGRDTTQPESVLIAPDMNRPLRFGRIIRLYSGDEGYYNEQAGFSYLDTSTFAAYTDQALRGRDTLARGIRAWRAEAYTNPHQYVMSSQQEISVEFYPFGVSLETLKGIDHPDAMHVKRFGLPRHIYATPSIREHNGGRMSIPLLDLQAGRASDRDSVEIYARAWNRLGLGVNADFAHRKWPYDDTPLGRLGPAAWASRRTGRRLIHWPGFQYTMWMRWRYDTATKKDVRDTVYTHMVEPSEVRAMVNIGLAYGSTGVHYSQIGGLPHNYYPNSVWLQGAGRWSHDYEGEFSPVGFKYDDTLDTYASLELSTPSWMDNPQTDHLINFWTGWGIHRTELRWLNRTWLPAIGDTLMKLRWRDAYSIHYTTPQSYWDPEAHMPDARPLPAGEIVQSIEAYDRYGRKDVPENTFVELGLFDAQRGRNADGSVNPLRDTNHIFVVNRRCFQRPGDIAATSPMGRHMDSLAEVRTLKIRFNLHNPVVGAQYANYIRIREIVPDTTRLPGATAPRAGLDTVIYGDSAASLTLIPGSAALLRITYCNPNERVDTGDLRYSSQRKLLFDGRRYSRVYFRKLRYWLPPAKVVQTEQEHIFYSRSLPVGTDTTDGAVCWDPRAAWSDVLVSDTNDVCYSAHRFPSLTLRADSSRFGDTVVSIVWTSHACDVQGGYAVLTRNLLVNGDNTPTMSTIDRIGTAMGTSDTIWGVPVVSRLHGGELFAWGDTVNGIKTRLRTHDSVSAWWRLPGRYSAQNNTTNDLTKTDGPGCYPSMPPFAHIRGRDSSVGLVWQQPRYVNGAWQGNRIMYQRMVHIPVQPGNVRLASLNRMQVSQTIGTHKFPSIDMTQDVWAGAQEGIAWQEQSFSSAPFGFPKTTTMIHFSSLWTETSRSCDPNAANPNRWRPYWDCIEPVNQWTYNTFIAGSLPGSVSPDFYPSTASLNSRADSAHQNDSIYFSVVLTKVALFFPMQQMIIQYADHATEWPTPQRYLYGGFYPSSSASGVRQHTREAVLYQTTAPMAGALETSRQFFAKQRPTGYMAHGRTVHFRLSDTGATTISGGVHDVWFASDAASGDVTMAPRPESLRRTDALNDVRTLMRTMSFTAHDSTTIGCELHGRFSGDSALSSGMSVLFVAELMNASNDVPVAVLDSFRVAPGVNSVSYALERTFDLLSGAYYVRLRVEPENVRVDTIRSTSLYPVEETAGWVENEPAAKFRVGSATAGTSARARIAVQPNPVVSTGRVLYSVPDASTASIVVRDAAGRTVATPLAPSAIGEGRYALDVDTRGMAPGTYLVELRAGTARAVTKMVVVR